MYTLSVNTVSRNSKIFSHIINAVHSANFLMRSVTTVTQNVNVFRCSAYTVTQRVIIHA